MQAGWKRSLRPGGQAWNGLWGWLALTAMAGCSLDRSPQVGDGRGADPADAGTGQAAAGGVGAAGGAGGIGGMAGMAGIGGMAGSGGTGATGGSSGTGATGGSSGTGGASGSGGAGGASGSGGSGGTGGTTLAPNGCKTTDTCQVLGGFGNVCVEATMLPRSCIMASDCADYGPTVPCSVLPFGLFCIVGCTP